MRVIFIPVADRPEERGQEERGQGKGVKKGKGSSILLTHYNFVATIRSHATLTTLEEAHRRYALHLHHCEKYKD